MIAGIKMAVENSELEPDWAGSTLSLSAIVRQCVAETDDTDSVSIHTPRVVWTSDTPRDCSLPYPHPDISTQQQQQPLNSSSSRASVASGGTLHKSQVNVPAPHPLTSPTVDFLQDHLSRSPRGSTRGAYTTGRTFTPPPPRLLPSMVMTDVQTSFSAPLITVRPKSSPSLRVVLLKDFETIELQTRDSGTSTDSRGPICRICHEGASNEQLLAPCMCRGTVGLLHRSCIERWLSASNTEACEICGFRYTTRRKHRSFCEWLTKTDDMIDLRNIIADICCFLLLTPLTAVSAWLCLCGALQFAPPTTPPARSHSNMSNTRGWESVALIMLSMFLLLVYVVWCIVAVNYHTRVFTDWKRVHQVVTIVLTSEPSSPQRAKPLSSVRAVPVHFQNNPNTAACVPKSTTAFLTNSSNADVTRQWEASRAYLYTKSRIDGRWSFGKLPATSVSDTVMTSWHNVTWEHKSIDYTDRDGR